MFTLLVPQLIFGEAKNDTSRLRDSLTHPTIEEPLIENQRVYASYDPASGYFCNNRVLVDTTKWSHDVDGDGIYDTYLSDCSSISTTEVTEIEQDLNAVYCKIGIFIKVIYGGSKNINANLSSIDIWISDEQDLLHKMQYGFLVDSMDNPIENDTTFAWIIDDKNLGIRGRASKDEVDNPRNSILYNKAKAVSRTFAHEYGHAKFKLYHPDGSEFNADGSSTGITDDKGWDKDSLSKTYGDDFFNLMNSGYLYHQDVNMTKCTHNLNKIILRQYQWSKIIKQL